MLGFSVFLGRAMTDERRAYIQAMQQAGFDRIFTSLQIPEEDPHKILKHLQQLGEIAKKAGLEVMADVSDKGSARLGIDQSDPAVCEQLAEMGITGLRMDDGVDVKTIARLSQTMIVGLNASTLTDEEVEQLRKSQADFSKMELWHNYYPRPETGLAESYLQLLNHKWRALGMKIVAFVSGDEGLRGPLYEGLPTLEKHRQLHPLKATIDLLQNYDCDTVYIGDEGLCQKSRSQFVSYFNKGNILLEVELTAAKYRALVLGKHTNRLDDARDVIRSQEGRRRNQGKTIAPADSLPRVKGSVTVDNQNYLRYMGEVQLAKRDLPLDHKVNVAAVVVPEDIALIEDIGPGTSFELIEKGLI